MREQYLKADFSMSATQPSVYDTDLENFWTQTSLKF